MVNSKLGVEKVNFRLGVLVIYSVSISHSPIKLLRVWVMTMKIINYCVLILFSLVSVGAAYGCDLDQAERDRYNMQLLKKYPGSKYIKKRHTILIPEGENEVSLNIGGCVNYGVSIELKTKKTNKFDDEAKLTEMIYELSKEYSQGLIEHSRVEKVIAGKKWASINPEVEGYYILNYDENSTFEFYRRNEQGSTYVGVYYYR